jgi:hypothetical protein
MVWADLEVKMTLYAFDRATMKFDWDRYGRAPAQVHGAPSER